MIKNKISCETHAPQARFFNKQNAPHGKTYQTKYAAGRIYLTKSSWVLCPVNAVCNFFSTNHSSQSSSFNQFIHELLNGSIH